jgi:hypothetical protein
MNLKKNKTLVTVVVLFVAFGLVIAYVPLIFSPSPSPSLEPVYQEQGEEISAEPPATASLAPPVVEPGVATTTPTPTEEETFLPDSFSGLEEENESLDDFLNF